MKKLLPWITLLILLSLAACSLPARSTANKPPVTAATPTLSAVEMQTQISQMLTLMPTGTGQPEEQATVTPGLPTVEVATPEGEGAAGVIVTMTPTIAPPTATLPAASPTSAPASNAYPAPATATTAPQPAPTATTAAGPTTTPLPGDPRGILGNPTSTDNMDNDLYWVWPVGSDPFSRGTFYNGMQIVEALASKDGWRLANPENGNAFTNLYLEAKFRVGKCSGSDHYGIIVRVPEPREPDQGYLFAFTCDGRYSIRRWNGEIKPKGEGKYLVFWTASPAIVTGSTASDVKTNTMGVWTKDDRLLLYANGKLLADVRDATFKSGYFGVLVGADVTENLTVEVDQMSYWKNPSKNP